MGLRTWFFENQPFGDLVTKVNKLDSDLMAMAVILTGIAGQFPITVDTGEVVDKLNLLLKPQMSIWFEAGDGKKDEAIDIPVYVKGENLWEIKAFGLNFLFEADKFEFIGAQKGALTADWNGVAGNEASVGNATIGGFAGAGSPVIGDSAGVLFVIQLKVLVDGFVDTQMRIQDYVDDISEMKPQPLYSTFIYRE